MITRLLQIRKSAILIISIFLIVCTLYVALVIILKNSKEPMALNVEELKTLKFVQVIFRHGQRTNVDFLIFPNDPNKNYSYPPYGLGELTNDGKHQMYNVGKYLRQRYGHFLDDYYTPNLIKATTSDSSRTQSSLQLVLAGLFPPKDEQIWENSVKWQPIPYQVIPKDKDIIFRSLYCPGYKKVYREFINTPEKRKTYEENKEFFDYVSLHTGWNITRPAQLHLVYETLTTEERFGLTLPKWTETVYPDELRKWTILSFKNFCGTDRLKRLYAGFLLKILSKEIYDKIDGKINEKFSLYSGHDNNVFGLASILNLFEEHLVPYGAYILMELHKINNNYTLKFLYQDYNQPEPKIMKLLNGDTSITIDDYSKLIGKYLPEDDECELGPDGIQLIYDF